MHFLALFYTASTCSCACSFAMKTVFKTVSLGIEMLDQSNFKRKKPVELMIKNHLVRTGQFVIENVFKNYFLDYYCLKILGFKLCRQGFEVLLA